MKKHQEDCLSNLLTVIAIATVIKALYQVPNSAPLEDHLNSRSLKLLGEVTIER